MKNLSKFISFIFFLVVLCNPPVNASQFRCPSLLDIKALINKKLGKDPFSPPLSYHGLTYINADGFTSGYYIDIPWQIHGGGTYQYSDLDNLKDVSRIGYMAPNPSDTEPWHMFMCTYPLEEKPNVTGTPRLPTLTSPNNPQKKECAFVVTLLQSDYMSCTFTGNTVSPTPQGNQEPTTQSLASPIDQSKVLQCSDVDCYLDCTINPPQPKNNFRKRELPQHEERVHRERIEDRKPQQRALATSNY